MRALKALSHLKNLKKDNLNHSLTTQLVKLLINQERATGAQEQYG